MAITEERNLFDWRKTAMCQQLLKSLESERADSFVPFLREKASAGDFSNFSEHLQGQIVFGAFEGLLHSSSASQDQKELARRETEGLLKEKISPEEAWELLGSISGDGENHAGQAQGDGRKEA